MTSQYPVQPQDRPGLSPGSSIMKCRSHSGYDLGAGPPKPEKRGPCRNAQRCFYVMNADAQGHDDGSQKQIGSRRSHSQISHLTVVRGRPRNRKIQPDFERRLPLQRRDLLTRSFKLTPKFFVTNTRIRYFLQNRLMLIGRNHIQGL
jgi:hypothetical protein